MLNPAMPTSTVEDYLKGIYREERRNAGELVSTGRIATAMQVSPGTVTAMMKTLTDSGLVSYAPYMGVRLTEAGRKLATHVLRRHRLVELFLVEVMRMDWSEVHQDAEVLEHAVSFAGNHTARSAPRKDDAVRATSALHPPHSLIS